MDKNPTTFDGVDSTQGMGLIVVEVDVVTPLSCDRWQLVLRINGDGDIFAGNQLLLKYGKTNYKLYHSC